MVGFVGSGVNASPKRNQTDPKVREDVEIQGLSVMSVRNVTKTDGKRASGKASEGKRTTSTIPRKREELLKWNGWGYKDSKFVLREDKELISFTGNRYAIGNADLPYFLEWVKSKFNLSAQTLEESKNGAKSLPKPEDYPKPVVDDEFMQKLNERHLMYSLDGLDRLVRSHGHALHDIIHIRELNFKKQRIPDLVVWPEKHEDVVFIVNEANLRNIVLIPFGGGTSVSWAVSCPEHETRMFVSLDTSQMNNLLWLDEENLVACFESGIVGQDLERVLRAKGYTSGHEPDSFEFSSLGGWVATRASGMKKNTYGNIEDLLVSVKMVTPMGVLQKKCQVPRMSCGPDFNHVILGSEGTLGVITEVIIKIRPVPKSRKYGSIVFPNFELGFHAVREIARNRYQPSSIRLMDNEQFKFGQSLRPASSYLGLVTEGLKKMYITKIKGFDPNQMCVTTLLFEGDEKEIEIQEKRIYKIAVQFGGIPAGEKNGERGYTLTFVIAYIRDFALDFKIFAESFETSVPWDRALPLCKNVKHRVSEECAKHGIKYFLISARVTQSYDVGCCIYFYFGFNGVGVDNPMECYGEIEDSAREEILAVGGSISHHHGVGKVRARWYPQQVSELGVELYKLTKSQLDPKNIFANGNLITLHSHL
ncbi:hypothetical protein RUM44_010724 [Polyplax serrata]|uniref:Alkylglycerone-phosphate synthase n=1 Tax=Polyplax serrata TaxID=468196 RepID=A0ABR1AN04_POLSC